MTEPEAKSAATATDVGSILKQARLRRGQSFEMVFQHTRIPKKLLESLENNRFDEFPAKIYLQGFLKSYCEHLDLEFEPLWNQIRPSPTQPETPPESKGEEISPAPAPQPAPVQAKEEPGETSPARSYTALVAVAITGALALFGLIWGIGKSIRTKPAPPPLSEQPPQPQPLAPVVRPPEKLTLTLVFLNEAWISLRCDDHLRFEGRGPAGFTQNWSADKEFSLRTSSPGDLSLTLDGKNYPLASAARNSSGEYLIRRP